MMHSISGIFKKIWAKPILLLVFGVILTGALMTGCGQSGEEAKAAIAGYKGEKEEEAKALHEAEAAKIAAEVEAKKEEAKKAAKEAEEKNAAEIEAANRAEAERAAEDAKADADAGEAEGASEAEDADVGEISTADSANTLSGGNTATDNNVAAPETASLQSQNQQYVVPYASCTFSKIGQNYDTFHVAGSETYDSAALKSYMYGNYGLNSGVPADCVAADYNGYTSRIGVKSNRIIYDVQDSYMQASAALPALLTGTDPLIVYGLDNSGKVVELQAIWRGNNGYFVAFLDAKHYPGGTYKDEILKYTVSTVDLNYVARIPQEVLIANGGF